MLVGCSGFKFFSFFFHGILLVCGCGLRVALDLSFFFFVFVFLSLQISTFSCSYFVVKSMVKKNHEIFVIRFSFSLFSVCNFY